MFFIEAQYEHTGKSINIYVNWSKGEVKLKHGCSRRFNAVCERNIYKWKGCTHVNLNLEAELLLNRLKGEYENTAAST